MNTKAILTLLTVALLFPAGVRASETIVWQGTKKFTNWSDVLNIEGSKFSGAKADDVLHLSSIHILAQKHKFDFWLNSGDSLLAANCLLVLCNRLTLMLRRQIESQLNTFREEGGFTEGLTADRLAYRTQQNLQNNAPTCPRCGKPMIKRVAKKGIHSGKEFWSCSSYPECTGTLKIT